MFSTNRTIAAISIVIFGIFFAVVIGLKAAKFADNHATASQDRIDAAFAVLDK